MSEFFPAIPGIEEIKRFLRTAKEVFELGLGNAGTLNSEGRYLDEWITRRMLLDEIVNSGLLTEAISYTVNISNGLQDPADKYISSGVLTAEGQGLITVYAESGTTDILDKIEGLSKGQAVYLVAASTHVITVTAGTYLKMPSSTWTLTGNRLTVFQCLGGDVCYMRTTSENLI